MKRTWTWRWALAGALAAGWALAARSAEEAASPPPDRMAWWREARFGMFIHWGIYSIPATNDAWYIHFQKMPNAEYVKYAGQFNPVKFDARRWVGLARDAGMKYLVITSKHHDGFCMFDTKATDYNVVAATPWKHDPLKDISEECRRQGIKFCVYYSIMDWHHPDQMPANDDPQNPHYNDNRMRPGRKDAYVQYMKTQLKEMIDQYHPAVIWFDGQWPGWWENGDGYNLYQWLLKQDPELIISDRVKGTGDFLTPEGSIPATGLPGDWETCMTIGKTWGYDKVDNDFKPVRTLIGNLAETASKGGNYLLNVGPTAEGVIPDPQVERLEAIGKWMKVNGEAIYGTTASPFKHLAWGRCTKKVAESGTTLYLMVFDWPADKSLFVPGLRNKVKSATLLAEGKKLKFTTEEDGVNISVRSKAPDATCSVIKVEIEGKPDVGPEVARPLKDGTFALDAATAKLNGPGLRLYEDKRYPNGFVGDWWHGRASVDWIVRFPKPGTYAITVEVARPGDPAPIVVSVGDKKIEARVPNTGTFIDFKKTEIGMVTVSSAGAVDVRVCAVEQGWLPINLATVTLTPKK